MHDFDAAFAAVIGVEGGYSAIRADPGNWTGGRVGAGELLGTKYGIAANTYPHEDIRNLSLERAKELYHRDYWEPIHGDALPFAVALNVFDGAVNSGVAQAVRWIQRAASTPEAPVSDDGVFGPITLAAILRANPQALAARFEGQRLKFMADRSTWPTFGRGWARRVGNNLVAIPL